MLDVTTPANPQRIGGYAVQNGGVLDVALRGNYAFIAEWPPGLSVLDISEPAKPILVGHQDSGSSRSVGVGEGCGAEQEDSSEANTMQAASNE